MRPEPTTTITLNARAYNLLKALKRLRPGTTVHGLRRSFGKWCEEATDFRSDVSEKSLAHSIGSITERSYKDTQLLDKRRVLMQAWCDYCDGSPSPADKVIEIKPRVA